MAKCSTRSKQSIQADESAVISCVLHDLETPAPLAKTQISSKIGDRNLRFPPVLDMDERGMLANCEALLMASSLKKTT